MTPFIHQISKINSKLIANRLIICGLALSLASCGSNSPTADTGPAQPVSVVDTDNDGVFDSADNCPVDINPSQTDADNDGLGDTCDQCAGTPSGETANGNGCSASQLDSDGDGVNDDVDTCPGTASGTTVTANGCPDATADSDNDGVSDAIDVCPDSVTGLDSSGTNNYTFDTSTGCPTLSSSRDGISYDVFLGSDVDGERIAFTIHEPRTMNAGDTFPMIGNGHGYSGSRTSSRAAAGGTGMFSVLADAGYGVFSMDQRGHGDSGGQIRLLDPEVEGQDILQILDWIGNEVNWIIPEGGGDYVLGAFGSSYGGGFQHTAQKLDPLNRLDAIAPDITWNDLRYSINTNNVFKSKWGFTLSTLAQSTPGGHHDQVNQGLAQGLSTGDIGQIAKDLLYFTSYKYNCDGTNVGNDINRASTNTPMDAGLAARPVPAFYTQGTSDTLFDLTDAYRNYTCQRNAGSTDVRLYTQAFSHDELVGSRSCGSLNHDAARLAFFDAHLKGDNTDLANYPDICIDLGGTKSIQRSHAQGFPYGNDGNAANDLTADYLDPTGTSLLPFAFQEAGNTVVNVPVYTAMAVDEILAGIPTIELNITRDAASAAVPTPATIFVGISISTTSGLVYMLPNQTASGTGQVTPFKDTEISSTDLLELAGIEVVLQPGDIVAVRYSSSDPTYLNSGTTVPLSGTIEATVHLPLLGSRGGPSAPIQP